MSEMSSDNSGILQGDWGRSATEDERKMLRQAVLVREATPEEVEAWMVVSGAHMSDKAKSAFYDMNREQQYRVMYEGPLTDCKDSTEILYARIQRFMDMENQLKKLANADTEVKESKHKEKKISDLAVAVGKALVATDTFEEVPEHERRFAAPAAAAAAAAAAKAPVVDASSAGKLVGKVRGMGGVIEALQKRYNMAKGERAKVVSETRELWKFADGRNVPKTQCNQGWKWVLDGPDPAEKKKKPPQQQQPAAAAAPAPGAAEEPREAAKVPKEADAKDGQAKAAKKRARGRSGSPGDAGRSRGRRRGDGSSGGSGDGAAGSRSAGCRGRKAAATKRRARSASSSASPASSSPQPAERRAARSRRRAAASPRAARRPQKARRGSSPSRSRGRARATRRRGGGGGSSSGGGERRGGRRRG